jgi:molybdopterin-guanine dinucleotide biosynthesis protein A
VERLLTVVDDVVVAGDVAVLPSDRVRVVQDVATNAGPIGGLIAGLDSVVHDRSLVIACDLPFLDVALLRRMMAVPPAYELLVPRRANGTLEMLHAVYRRSVRDIARRSLAKGCLRLSDLARAIEADGGVVQSIDEAWVEQSDPNLQSFVNINTPADLQFVRAKLALP